MSDPIALPEQTLAAYLEANVPGFHGPLTATKFKGGQSNPTYLIEAASGRYVLRRKPPGKLLASAHAVDREFRVLRTLAGGAIPVAQALHLCADDGVIGSMFYLMSYVPGRIFWDPALPELAPGQRAAHFETAVDTLAALARLDVAGAGLGDYGKPGNYFARQVSRWSEQYRSAETERIEAMETLIAWLPGSAPPDEGRVALVHGDFRIDNLIWAADAPAPPGQASPPDSSPASIAAIVDWELSTLGHPLADLAYFCMALRLPRNPVLPGLAGIDRAALGIPDEAAMIERFAEATNLDPLPHWNFLLAFGFFRLAAIAQGVLKRALQGNASSEQALAAGRMTQSIAELGASVAH
ncbi:MAG TPA: phosphotransferase family protein [Rhodanobacteraceae bacterium]|jgi:aminoglycoside phosphotransferase (APT) family kinase protein|nr:phosphotransferase family protein [Rhodanobacteraceae bacterium]